MQQNIFTKVSIRSGASHRDQYTVLQYFQFSFFWWDQEKEIPALSNAHEAEKHDYFNAGIKLMRQYNDAYMWDVPLAYCLYELWSAHEEADTEWAWGCLCEAAHEENTQSTMMELKHLLKVYWDDA